MCAPRAASHTTSGGAIGTAHAVTLPTRGLSSSSSSSSCLDDQHEFRELVRRVDEARQRYSDSTYEVSQLECCLDAVRVALEASKRETAVV